MSRLLRSAFAAIETSQHVDLYNLHAAGHLPCCSNTTTNRLAAHLCLCSDLSITHLYVSCRCFLAIINAGFFRRLSVGRFVFSFQYFHDAIYQCTNFFAAVIHFFKSNIFSQMHTYINTRDYNNHCTRRYNKAKKYV